jgi:hypothetical protein
MATLIILLCMAAPPFFMWWMLRVQRRVRAQMRVDREAKHHPDQPAYVDEVHRIDGLAYGRPTQTLLPPAPDPGDLAGIKAIEGRR